MSINSKNCSAGFSAYLFAQMRYNFTFNHMQAGFHWTYLNLMILTLFVLNLQLHLRWHALLDAALILGYYLYFGTKISVLGLVAVIIAGGALYVTQAFADRLVQSRVYKYSTAAVFAAACLVMSQQMTGMHADGWFWLRQVGALAVLAVLELEFEQIMRMTQRRTDRIQSLVTIDELTGVHNFGMFNKELANQFTNFQKNGTPYSVFEGDLDHFKQINDTYGHLSGNLVLQRLALELQSFAQGLPFEATAYRLGGEEFAIIAQAELNYEQALEIGERFQELLELVHFDEVDPGLTITCSIGQARVQASDYSADDVYKHADRNLYAAKRAGRNCVHVQPDNTTAE